MFSCMIFRVLEDMVLFLSEQWIARTQVPDEK